MSKLRSALGAADVIAVLGPEEVEIYQDLAPHARVGFVPHGVDTDWFYPIVERPANGCPVVLTVGNWLRDYETWAAVVRMASDARLDVRFRLLAKDSVVEEALSRLPERAKRLVERCARVDDSELRKLYWEADLLFLPLSDAMANNALLEAMATGTPVLTTRLPGCQAYAGEGAAYHEKGNPEDAFGMLEALLGDHALRLSLAQSSVARVTETLKWPAVIQTLDELADSV